MNNNSITCPSCGKIIEITQILKEQVEKEVSELHRNEILLAQKKTEEKVRNELGKKSLEEINELKTSLEEKNKKLDEMREQEIRLREERRKLEEREKELQLTTERKIDEERKKIEYDVLKRADEEHRLKDLEKEKKLQDALKTNEELRRRLEQGSQQTQGEVLEELIETTLKRKFLTDIISPVPKGIRGADVIQTVIDKYGNKCGTIIWESKNARWSDGWIDKLKDDQRLVKADVAVLVSVELPKDVENFDLINYVWVSNKKSILGLATAIRIEIIKLFHANITSSEKLNDQMKNIYTYLTSNNFKQRIEAIIEAFQEIGEDMETEKRWFAKKWAKQESHIRKVIDNTYGIYGELQTEIGKEKLQIKGLDLIESAKE